MVARYWGYRMRDVELKMGRLSVAKAWRVLMGVFVL